MRRKPFGVYLLALIEWLVGAGMLYALFWWVWNAIVDPAHRPHVAPAYHYLGTALLIPTAFALVGAAFCLSIPGGWRIALKLQRLAALGLLINTGSNLLGAFLLPARSFEDGFCFGLAIILTFPLAVAWGGYVYLRRLDEHYTFVDA